VILPAKRLIAAIDTADPTRAAALISCVAPHCGLVKLGLEFFLRNGPDGLAATATMPFFLDLKLHDIPNTVAGAVRSLLPFGAAMLTIHATGGAAMIRAAVTAAAEAGLERPMILAVTVLTSIDAAGLHSTGVAGGTTQQVLRLARLALDEGADGLVCSARELPQLRDAFGETPIIVVPGLRAAGCAHGDQRRVMTPEVAVQSGASYVVVGRPITQSADPGQAAAAIAGVIG